MEAGINWPDEEIVNGPSAFDAMSTARERALVRKRLKEKGGDDFVGPEKFDPLTTLNGERGLKTNSVAFQGSKGFQSLMSLVSKIFLMLRISSISLSS